MKRVLSILLVTLLAFSAMSIMAVGAVGDPTVSVASVSATAGEEVEVNLSVANNPALTYLKVKVAYSANDVELLSAKTAAPAEFTFISNIKNTNHNPLTVQIDAEDGVEYSGAFATLKFKVLDGAKTSDVTITAVQGFDTDMKKVTFGNSVNGKITVNAPQPSGQAAFEQAIAAPMTKDADDDFGSVANFKGLEMLGVQQKTDVDDIRFVTAVSKDVLNDAGVVDYGYVVTKSSKSKADAEAAIGNLTADVVKYSCKDTTCTAAGAYGDGSKDYSYVTFGVNNIPAGKCVLARFYVQTNYNTTYYYAVYDGTKAGIVYTYAA